MNCTLDNGSIKLTGLAIEELHRDLTIIVNSSNPDILPKQIRLRFNINKLDIPLTFEIQSDTLTADSKFFISDSDNYSIDEPLIFYKTNKTINWTAYTFGTNILLTNNVFDNEITYIQFKNTTNRLTSNVEKPYNICTNTLRILNCFGNIMSMINFSKTLLFCEFAKLFAYANIISAEKLILPATSLANMCYWGMFENCQNLKYAPELPATTLAQYCYNHMFNGCTSLTTAPELPARELADDCDGCYSGMFEGCINLTTAPELPATTLAESCYSSMFAECRSLTKAPSILPATTLTDYCYWGMFENCQNLKYAPELPATELADNCYAFMFDGCTSLNSVKVGFTDWNISEDSTNGWLGGVSSEGTFVCPTTLSIQYGNDYIPEGWTIVHPETV